MAHAKEWRKKATTLLAAPVVRKRDLKTVIGKVEACFEEILAARQRRMAWKDIAVAIQDGESISTDAVESAFSRISRERGVATLPRRALTQPASVAEIDEQEADVVPRAKLPANAHGNLEPAETAREPETTQPHNLFSDNRWIDHVD